MNEVCVTVVSFGIVKNFGLFLVSAMCKMLQVFVSIMRQSGFFGSWGYEVEIWLLWGRA